MQPYFVHHPIGVVADVSLGLWIATELANSLRHRRGERTSVRVVDEIVFRLLAAVFLAGPVYLAALTASRVPSADVRPAVGSIVAGLVILWAGVGLRLWAIFSLGRYFTVVVRTGVDQPVIDHGPYRVLRHPSYTGLWVAIFGVGVLMGSWIGVAATLVAPVVALAYRIRAEERALLAVLGDRYRTYAAGRKRLVPGVW